MFGMTGDFVYVHPRDKYSGLFIARVEGVYQDAGARRFLNVRWYVKLDYWKGLNFIAQVLFVSFFI
jgi:hypothetical protein